MDNDGVKEMEYLERIADSQLRDKLETFGAVNIIGPKWCGKTRTAEQQCRSSIYFQSDPNKENLRQVAAVNPAMLLSGAQPKLIDEWQDAPEIWDSVRYACDHSDGTGHFVLTGSSSKKVRAAHTGTGRISDLMMYPMSLYESKESNGQVSLGSILDGDSMNSGCRSDLSVDNLIFAACRGGWPYSIGLKKRTSQLSVARDYFHQIYTKDMFSIDDVKRNPEIMLALLKSYGRNISTLAKDTNLLTDIGTFRNISPITLTDYLNVLRGLFVVQELHGWTPALRSSAGMRSGPKREFIDPSIAVSSLGTSPDKLSFDLKTFGFIFECLCIRDLRAYSSSMGGTLSYYHDRYGLEADSVLHLEDGRYVLFEFKLGSNEIENGAKHLLKLENLISEHIRTESQHQMDMPSAKVIITGTEYGYKRPDGVYVIPIGCLGP